MTTWVERSEALERVAQPGTRRPSSGPSILIASLLAAGCSAPSSLGRPVETRAFQSQHFLVRAPTGAGWFYDIDPGHGDLVFRRAHYSRDAQVVGVTAIWVGVLGLPAEEPIDEAAVVALAMETRERQERAMAARLNMSVGAFERTMEIAGERRVHVLRYRFSRPGGDAFVSDHAYLVWLPPNLEAERRLYFLAAAVGYEPGRVPATQEMELARTMLADLRPARAAR